MSFFVEFLDIFTNYLHYLVISYSNMYKWYNMLHNFDLMCKIVRIFFQWDKVKEGDKKEQMFRVNELRNPICKQLILVG